MSAPLQPFDDKQGPGDVVLVPPVTATSNHLFNSPQQGDASFVDTSQQGLASFHSQNFMDQTGSYSPVAEPQSFYNTGSQSKMAPSQSFAGMSSYASDFQPHHSSNSLYERDNASISSNQPLQDPYPWMTMSDVKEPDDDLHDPTQRDRVRGSAQRAILNISTLVLFVLALLMLFAGYPILHHYTESKDQDQRQADIAREMSVKPPIFADPKSFPLNRVNNTIPGVKDPRIKSLIDPDTPKDAYTMSQFYSKGNGKKYQLVFSDEFNVDGRSFYAGEDPFWEAVDLHYWATNNFEWYDPAAITTQNGSLRIKLEEHPEHGVNFRGGMLQSWNKFCFRGGIITGRIQLPGFRNVQGLWPAFWLMGNLGRAGYGATLEGTWPYSYEACDVGTVQNQTMYNRTYPQGYPPYNNVGGAYVFNKKHNTTSLSFLPGQKLSACTCPDDDHPGPKVNNEWKGRSAPEIDVFEAQTSEDHVGVSQSCQMAPYNWLYDITMNHNNGQPGDAAYNDTLYKMFRNQGQLSELNSYQGEITQQSLSGVAWASQQAVQYAAKENWGSSYLDPQLTEGGELAENFAVYSLEYAPGTAGHAAWKSNDQPTWELYPKALQPDLRSKISARPFPSEPMYILLNLGISENFGNIQWDKIITGFPFEMAIDYVRVYQDPDAIDIGCDTPEYPSKDYIEKHKEAYTNSDFTVWGGSRDEGGYGADWPRNRLYSSGCKGLKGKDPGDPNPKVSEHKATLYSSTELVTATVISNPLTIRNATPQPTP
ncbi:hypothetical protein MVES_001058 [Malassezia vespertilionis]|uniref:GH16 domain-containing protein n=1 Tax=Malassezia vespertilionis TaxID=2020962 RepID=A0A2N1JE77_9BASI|nr:hypothetical protein MVES_001058 [Malassezia vespertilionis]